MNSIDTVVPLAIYV